MFRGALACPELVGEIADLMDLDVLVPQIMLLTRGDVREIVHGFAAETEEVIITALERTEFWQSAQMPLADQASAVARLLQQRRESGMLGREADLRVAKQRLGEGQVEPILVAAGDQCETRGGADGGIGVTLKEAHSSRGDAVNIWRGKVAASVTGHVGIAEVVGKNKDDVRRPRGRLGMCTDPTGRERSRPEGGVAQQLTTRHSRLPSHRRVLRSAEAPTTLSAKSSAAF